MARFKRLTATEARTLTRDELLDRIEREQQYWMRKRISTPEDHEAYREFSRIMHASINPGAAIAEALAVVKGEHTGPSYWAETPDVPDADLSR